LNKKNESTYTFDGNCNYCGKHCHKEADCWKKKQDNGEAIPNTCGGCWCGWLYLVVDIFVATKTVDILAAFFKTQKATVKTATTQNH
jgi:hypothetical protein